MYKLSKTIFLVAMVFSFISCTSDSPEQDEGALKSKPLDTQMLNRLLKVEGQTQGGSYKMKVPQNDLNVMVDGFKIISPMGATSWIAFTPAPEGARILGDIVVKEEEVGAVEAELFKQGLHATALHKHFVGEEPRVMYMHVGGSGTQEVLAHSVRAVFDRIEALRGEEPSKAPSSAVSNSLDIGALAHIIGYPGATTDGVFKISIGRPDVNLNLSTSGDHEEYREENQKQEEYQEKREEVEREETEAGGASGEEKAAPVHVTAFTGFNTWAAFQGTPDNAAVAGDFAMLADEVPAVMQTLIENGFTVVSLHNHMINEHPRIFFLHYWGTGNAQELARGLRKALDKTGEMERG